MSAVSRWSLNSVPHFREVSAIIRPTITESAAAAVIELGVGSMISVTAHNRPASSTQTNAKRLDANFVDALFGTDWP